MLTNECDDSQIFSRFDIDQICDDGRREVADDDEEGDAGAEHEPDHAHLLTFYLYYTLRPF